ncbi:MAG: IclR family transcriptional regulator, partial [Chloroflexota bacterium]|nr:IclR family transcriptional regulator [Chloroflexota bacterium]
QKPAYPIESVDKALTLLLLLRERRALTVTEASRELEVAASTAHRLLAMLQYRGFVVQDPVTKTYLLGPVLAELGLAAVRGMDIRAEARPVMERLVAEVGETVHLGVLRGTDVLFLESVESASALRVADRTGMTLPAHASAVGKALLAELSTEQLHILYPDANLPLFRPNTITRRDTLEQALAAVRERGYATNADESEAGVSGVAAPIRDSTGRVRAALTVSAPTSRLSEEQVAAIAPATIRAAAEIGARLG